VDRYHDVLSLQILTQAMDAAPVREAILQTAARAIAAGGNRGTRRGPHPRARAIGTARSSALAVGRKEFDGNRDESRSLPLRRLEGQKTGGFLDQRENYAAAAEYAHGEALDAFCYQGGFALHLALGAGRQAAKCSSVTGVDSSRPALEMAEKNAR
jgi:23S rRNA (cytosine1962-C5)-methyltransferase